VKDITLPYGFKPRHYQKPVMQAFLDGVKRFVLCWHRRSGKDLTILNQMIIEMCRNRGIYYYILPTYSQAKKVIWDNLTIEGKRYLDFFPPDLVANINNHEMKITLINGSVFQLVGSNNYDSLMGTNPRGIVFSEYALQDVQAWNYLRPIMRANPEGIVCFISTPRGKNHFYDLYRMAEGDPDWYAETLTIDDTGFLTEEDMDRERAEGMSDHLIQQEFYCNFEMGTEGSYYAKYLQDVYNDGRVISASPDPLLPVYTAWDLGMSDSTSIIFFQRVGKDCHIIDYYENHGEGLPHYAKVLQDRNYLYGDHFAPHDIEVRELSHGLSRRDIAKELGIRFRIVPKLSVAEGIEIARGTFPRLWFDRDKCKYLLKCLESYHKEFNDKLNVYSDRPCHDFSSHPADAFRYMCIALKSEIKGAMTQEEAEALERQYFKRL